VGDERVRGEPKQLRLEELDDGVPVRKFVYGGIGLMKTMMMALCAKKAETFPKLSPIHIELQFAQII
jgi:hypothetical protein